MKFTCALFPNLNLSMVIVSHNELNSETQYSKSNLLPSIMPKPSWINNLPDLIFDREVECYLGLFEACVGYVIVSMCAFTPK